MVKRSAVILGVLAMLALGVGMSWGYTVSQWPVPGIPNTTFGGSTCLVSPQDFVLRGPVAPTCTPSLFAGLLHAGMAAPFKVMAVVMNPLFGMRGDRSRGCCDIRLDGPAFVTAAVPCTPVNRFVPPCGF
ncbi:MAG: hypothetical protein WCG29_06520 [Desulfomonile sp.]|nr:hypothetical protein [Deltaproteobacteria bacterium]